MKTKTLKDVIVKHLIYKFDGSLEIENTKYFTESEVIGFKKEIKIKNKDILIVIEVTKDNRKRKVKLVTDIAHVSFKLTEHGTEYTTKANAYDIVDAIFRLAYISTGDHEFEESPAQAFAWDVNIEK